MSLDPSLAKPPDDAPAVGPVFGWDWTATTHEGREPKVIARELVGSLDAATVLPGKGRHGWTRSLVAFDDGGYRLGAVFLGGRDDVYFESTSAAADTVRDHVVTVDNGRTARVDTRVDSLVPFDALAEVLEAAADLYGSEVTYYEKRRNRESAGRTIYLGAPSSAVRVRLYEKWKESPGQYVEGTNRVEVQLRPASRVKERVSSWTREETFCASRVTQRLADELGADLIPTPTLHVDRGTPDLERTLRAMGEQYGPSVDRWLKHTGGDMTRVYDYLVGREEPARDPWLDRGAEFDQAVSVALDRLPVVGISTD